MSSGPEPGSMMRMRCETSSVPMSHSTVGGALRKGCRERGWSWKNAIRVLGKFPRFGSRLAHPERAQAVSDLRNSHNESGKPGFLQLQTSMRRQPRALACRARLVGKERELCRKLQGQSKLCRVFSSSVDSCGAVAYWFSVRSRSSIAVNGRLGEAECPSAI